MFRFFTIKATIWCFNSFPLYSKNEMTSQKMTDQLNALLKVKYHSVGFVLENSLENGTRI